MADPTAALDTFTLAPPPPSDDPRWPLFRATSEAEWQGAVMDTLAVLGWHALHVWLAVRSSPGFPDVFAIRRRDGRALVLELKREGRRPSARQIEWLTDCRAAGIPAYVLYPHDRAAFEDLAR